MTPDDLRLLAARATTVESSPEELRRDVHARIGSMRRRRQVVAVVATVIAVVLALTAGTAVLRLVETAPPPANPPSPIPTPTPPTPKVDDNASSGRQVTYAKGSTIHWGDQTVDVGGKVSQVRATDDGAVFMREAKGDCFKYAAVCNELWLTEGTEIVHIGTVYGSVIRGFWLDGSSSGSTLVWFEPSPENHPHGSGYDLTGEYVVYDTHERREVARMGFKGRDPGHNGDDHLKIQAVFEDSVYWTPDDRGKEWCLDYSKYYGACRHFRAVMRLDTSTGTQTEVPWATYISDRRSRPRLFFGPTDRPDAPFNPFPDNRPGAEAITFGRQGDRLVAEDLGGVAAAARLGLSGPEVRLRLPAGYDDADAFFTVEWLDDVRVVLMADNKDDLFVCRLPGGRCKAVAKGPLFADFGGRG